MKSKLQERREGKFSQIELSKAAGLNPQAIHQYETGIRSIDGCNIKALARIAKALNCKIIDLIEDPETVSLLLDIN